MRGARRHSRPRGIGCIVGLSAFAIARPVSGCAGRITARCWAGYANARRKPGGRSELREEQLLVALRRAEEGGLGRSQAGYGDPER